MGPQGEKEAFSRADRPGSSRRLFSGPGCRLPSLCKTSPMFLPMFLLQPVNSVSGGCNLKINPVLLGTRICGHGKKGFLSISSTIQLRVVSLARINTVLLSENMVLKGIPSVLSPELLYTLALMGHGDELVLADANFPASSTCACGPKEIRADGLGIPQLLKAILKLFPLDTYVPFSAAVMDLVDSDNRKGLLVPVWDTYLELLNEAGYQTSLQKVERFAFYERAKKAYAVVATGETALYGNVILKKGIIPAELLQ